MCIFVHGNTVSFRYTVKFMPAYVNVVEGFYIIFKSIKPAFSDISYYLKF